MTTCRAPIPGAGHGECHRPVHDGPHLGRLSPGEGTMLRIMWGAEAHYHGLSIDDEIAFYALPDEQARTDFLRTVAARVSAARVRLGLPAVGSGQDWKLP